MDLAPFCTATRLGSPAMAAPFTVGLWTYATDGHIGVRVPAVAYIAPLGHAPDVERVFKEYAAGCSFSPLRVALPPIVLCPTCYGRKNLHDCKTCECACPTCGGQSADPDANTSVGMRGAIFQAKLIRRVLSLGHVEFSDDLVSNHGPMRFRFKGGEGLVMPLRSRSRNHLQEPETDFVPWLSQWADDGGPAFHPTPNPGDRHVG